MRPRLVNRRASTTLTVGKGGWLHVVEGGFAKIEGAKHPVYRWAVMSKPRVDLVASHETHGPLTGGADTEHDVEKAMQDLLAFLIAAADGTTSPFRGPLQQWIEHNLKDLEGLAL